MTLLIYESYFSQISWLIFNSIIISFDRINWAERNQPQMLVFFSSVHFLDLPNTQRATFAIFAADELQIQKIDNHAQLRKQRTWGRDCWIHREWTLINKRHSNSITSRMSSTNQVITISFPKWSYNLCLCRYKQSPSNISGLLWFINWILGEVTCSVII